MQYLALLSGSYESFESLSTDTYGPGYATPVRVEGGRPGVSVLCGGEGPGLVCCVEGRARG